MTIRLLTIDTETTLNGTEDQGIGHPMHPDNSWVYIGMKRSDIDSVGIITHHEMVGEWVDMDSFDYIVGHNLPFDLLHLYKDPTAKKWLQEQRIWDTQLAEYLISGQQEKWASLDGLAAKYGLPLKEDKIKEYFKAGIGADKIPREEIEPYLYQDVVVTEKIALKQLEKVVELGMMDLVMSQMEALHATTEMMFNGLKIGNEYFEAYTVECINDYTSKVGTLDSLTESKITDINSAKQWATYLFGGTTKRKEKRAEGLYKNGKPKYKTYEVLDPVKGISDIPPKDEWLSEKTKQVSVDDETITYLSKNSGSKLVRDVSEALLSYRTISKQLTTYIQGLGKHVMSTGYIHGTINHTATVTGRLSSTKPNLQNISNNPIKRAFISRWGSSGQLIEFDFDQLEVGGLAHVTKDKRLTHDIMSGADMHSELYKSMYGRYPTKEERKPFKSLSFGLIYGAGANTLAKNAGIDIAEAKRFVDTFYARYPQVKEWHNDMRERAEDESRYLVKDGVREKVKTFELKTETGRRFIFKQYYDERGWGLSDYNFSPTELKNYPVQGFATGDIVPLMLGVLFRMFKDRDEVKIVNTIHDSIMFDCRKEVVDEVIKEVRGVLSNTHKYFEATFNTPLTLKLTAGASVGDNWFDTKEVK